MLRAVAIWIEVFKPTVQIRSIDSTCVGHQSLGRDIARIPREITDNSTKMPDKAPLLKSNGNSNSWICIWRMDLDV
jgi:hypothetical protein